MTLYAYYDGHASWWVVTTKDPGPGRVLRIELEPGLTPSNTEIAFFSSNTEVEIET